MWNVKKYNNKRSWIYRERMNTEHQVKQKRREKKENLTFHLVSSTWEWEDEEETVALYMLYTPHNVSVMITTTLTI